MKVKIIRPTIALKRLVQAGDVLETSKEEAQQLILAGKAVVLRDEAPIETADMPTAGVEFAAVEKPKGYTKKKESK